MIVFPNAKINIGLNVTGKRADGYHNIESVFCPVNLCDALEVITAADGITELKQTGILMDTTLETNLVYKAYLLLAEKYTLPAIKIHLHKVIPTGAGLGGGSTDGAFMLKLLNAKYELNISNQQLKKYALLLGSDCPFFIDNTTSFVEGRGEEITPMNLHLENYLVLLVHPAIHVSTKLAYDKLEITQKQNQLVNTLVGAIVSDWRNVVVNDFEKSVFHLNPEIAELKKWMYENGAHYASMTGSGSAIYGLFQTDKINIDLPKNYFVWQGKAM